MDDKSQKAKLTIRQSKWLDAYLETLNATEATRRAGYKCRTDEGYRAIGSENLTKLNGLIQKWVIEAGFTPSRIKAKILEGMEAKETRFFSHEGKVTDQREVQAWAIQAKFTEMAAKVLSLFDSDLTGRVERLEQALRERKANGEH